MRKVLGCLLTCLLSYASAHINYETGFEATPRGTGAYTTLSAPVLLFDAPGLDGWLTVSASYATYGYGFVRAELLGETPWLSFGLELGAEGSEAFAPTLRLFTRGEYAW